MIEIRNKINQRLIVNLLSGPIDLLAKSTAVIQDDDFSSSHLQNLLGSGKVILVSRMEDRSKSRVTQRKVESPKKKMAVPESKSGSEISEAVVTAETEVSEIETNPDEPIEQPEPEETQDKERNRTKRRK